MKSLEFLLFACFTAAFVARPAGAVELARWSMDAGSGQVAVSTVNSPSADALFSGNPVWASSLLPPVPGNLAALQFGSDPNLQLNSFLETRTLTGVTGDGARSVSAWIRTLSSDEQVIVDAGEQASGSRFTIRLNEAATQGPAGALRLEVNGGYAVATTPIDDGQWHHVAATFPSGGSVDDVMLYVDGVLDGDLTNVPFGGVLDANVNTTSSLISIGRRVDSTSFFTGVIDEVQYWDEQISASTVASLVPAGPLPTLTLTVDRDSGAIGLSNGYGVPISDIVGYSLTSDAEALSVAGWTSVTENYDANSGGSQFDSDDVWTVLTDVVTPDGGDLSEFAAAGDGGVLSAVAPLSLGNAWVAVPFEDLEADLIFSNGDRLPIAVEFTGNAGVPFEMGDLNVDGQVDEGDWGVFRDNLFSQFPELTSAEAYRLGDMDLDGDSDRLDFELFEQFYDGAQGAGALQQLMSAAPEPSGVMSFLAAALVGLVFGWPRSHSNAGACVGVIPQCRVALFAIAAFSACSVTQADLVAYYTFESPEPYSDKSMNGADGALTGASTVSLVSDLFGDALMTLDGLDATANGRVTVPQASAPDFGTGDLSYSLWFKRAAQTESGSSDGLLDSLSGTTSGIQLMIQDGGVVNGRFDTADAGFITINSPAGAIEADTAAAGSFQWHHIAFSIDRTSASPSAALYVDGVSVGTVNGSLNDIIGGNISPSQDLFIGQGNTQLSGGSVDEVAFFDKALSQQEVQGLFSQSASPTDFLERLTIQVDVSSGLVTLGVNGEADLPFDYYEISSSTDSLDVSSWSSVQSQGPTGFPVGTGVGDGWEEAGGSSDSILGETYLTGSSTLGPASTPISLGALWRTDGQQDVSFVYRDATTGAFKQGLVEYVTGPQLPGDFNNDGTVDSIDYAVWRESLGQNIALPNEVATPGVVTSEDFATWSSNYGATSAAAGVASPVPVPRSGALLLAGLLFAAMHLCGRSGCSRCVPMLGCLVLCGSIASAARTADRLYQFGDDPFEAGQLNDLIVNNSTTSGFTFDSVGDSNSGSIVPGEFVDLQASGGVAYGNGIAPGMLAAQFNGDGDFLRGRRLGLPETSAASTTATLTDIVTQAGPFDYSGIANRGMQFWVNASVVGGVTQTVVRDTAQHSVAISDAGTWVMRYGSQELDSGKLVTAGQWTHVMLVRPYGGSDLGGARLYVDGEAVAAIPRGYGGGDNTDLVLGADLDADGNPVEFFSGLVDEMEMFVLGTSSVDKEQFGVFNPGVDNDSIASQLTGVAGDITLDGMFDAQDVNAFVSGWMSEQRINGVLVGDINSFGQGDLDFNGVVDIGDAVLMNNVTQLAGLGSIFAAISGSTAPEPHSLSVVALLASAVAFCRKK